VQRKRHGIPITIASALDIDIMDESHLTDALADETDFITRLP
jgi:hypothetical protein